MLWVALHFPGLRNEALAPLAGWACQFTPRVAQAPPDALLVEVAASLRYFGGQDAFLQTLRAGLDALGLPTRLAVAPTGLAALWRARGGGGPLATLPLEATGFDLDFFRGIGVATVGEALALPRDGLAQRCGSATVDALDRACGRLPETYAFFTPPACFSARLELPGEAAHAEALLFPARRLLAQLEGLLAARHEGIRAFTLRLVHFDSSSEEFDIRLASVSRDAARLAILLRERLDEKKLQQPVEAIELRAADFTPLGPRSGGLFGDAAREEENWSRLLERLRIRLGGAAVCGLATQPDHRPEHAWRRVEPGEWDPREFRLPGARPLWLLEQPRRLAESEFTLLAGPERIECGWWDGDEAKRDYFIARLASDAAAWIYREGGEWTLHGLFA
ncbi:MAG TPA: DNA polymerase Y family protein [Burkholderiales bacterium]|nr:DNA polymerase Y family protein [Burkholderiales bacterium]